MKTTTSPISSVLKYLQVIAFSAAILYFGKTLLIPLFFGLLIAMVMHPICKWLENHRWNKLLAITACLLIVTILFAILFALLIWQLKVFSRDAPAVLSKIELVTQQFQVWMEKNFGATSGQQGWIEKFTSTIGSILQATIETTINTVFIFLLTPVFAALFMYHRRVIVQFVKLVTPARYQPKMEIILQQTVYTYFRYIKGMMLVYLIVGILNSIGLLALGISHPVLFGMLCAIMTIIPYIGIFTSALLPISVAWIETGNAWYPLGVIAVFSFVQYLEANLIFPKVVGKQIHVSTLAMLVSIIAGGIIWGVAGMVLFIPFVAILKIAGDHIEELKPINLLLGRK